MTVTDLARVDEEILEQKMVLLNLYTRRNSLVPIHRLPTETLTTIFILCAHDFYCSQSPFWTEPSVPNWIKISYVCRHWRNVAINCPTLWSYIFITSQRWTEELLARSKQASLKIVANLGSQKTSHHAFMQATDHVERIEELRLHLTANGLGSYFLSKFISTPAPRLQNLELRGLRTSGMESLLSFKGYTPVLRTLRLSSCSVPWYSFMLKSLTTLVVSEVPAGLELPVLELLTILGCMPCLVHLSLNQGFASARDTLSNGVYTTAPKVNLSCLTYIALTAAPLSVIIVFLSCVNIPLKARLTLEQHYDGDYSRGEYAQFFALLSQRFSASGGLEFAVPIIRSLVIRFDPGSGGLVFDASEEVYNSPRGQDSPRPLPLSVMLVSNVDNERIISDICHLIPPTNLRTLLFSELSLSSGLWRSILEQFPHSLYIMLEGGDIPNNLTASLCFTGTEDTCVQDEHADQNLRVTGNLVPLLEELELYNVYFSTREDAEDAVIDLQDCLSTRTESRCRFKMTECRIPGNGPYHAVFDSNGWWEDETFRVSSRFDE